MQYAYRQGQIKGGPDKENDIPLPSVYTQQTKTVAERRVVLAGYRLADVLVAIANAPRGFTMPVSAAVIIGNRNSKIYHLSSCPGYNSASEKNRVTFKTEAEAQQAGYSKAGNCPQ